MEVIYYEISRDTRIKKRYMNEPILYSNESDPKNIVVKKCLK